MDLCDAEVGTRDASRVGDTNRRQWNHTRANTSTGLLTHMASKTSTRDKENYRVLSYFKSDTRGSTIDDGSAERQVLHLQTTFVGEVSDLQV